MTWSPCGGNDHKYYSINVSQEIFAMDMLKASKSSLKHRRKHVQRLYGDQA